MQVYTDYPFDFLGDEPHKEAPIRECRVIDYDGDKYCRIMVNGIISEVKIGYLYTQPGRCGDVPKINTNIFNA